jgi:pyrroloquinoline-quinone synthase
MQIEGQGEPSLSECLDDWMERIPVLKNGFFTGLADGSLDRAAFVRTQRQFYFAVRFFPRAMAALTARMPDSALRLGLVHNIAEEHGFDDEDDARPVGFDPSMAHDLTFLEFLQTLGVSAAEMAAEREGPAVRAFNTALIGACMMERRELAFACLGTIEYVFADVCEMIGKSVVEKGWIAAEELVHYKLHAQIDKRHARDFFVVLEGAWRAEPAVRAAAEDGMMLALYLFDRLYLDLDPATLARHDH